MKSFQGKLAIQQRVLPAYRAPFLDLLAERCTKGLVLFAGRPAPGEAIPAAETVTQARRSETRNVSLFRPGHPLFSCWQPGFTAWLAREDPDALILEANPRYFSSRRAIAWMQRRGKAVLGWGLGSPEMSGPLAGIRSRARRSLYASLDGMIAYSKRGAREYEAAGFRPSERIFVAYNAVAPPPENPVPERGPLKPPLKLLFVGRLQARKRRDLLLRASAALPSNLQPELVIVGDGPDRREIEALASRLYPEARFTGALYGDALKQAFEQADLFVLPGTGGLAVQEAMSYALPIIVAKGDGTQEDLVRPENGWLVRPDDADSLRERLIQALGSPSLRRMGEASRRIVVEEINLHTMADSFVSAASAVMGKA